MASGETEQDTTTTRTTAALAGAPHRHRKLASPRLELTEPSTGNRCQSAPAPLSSAPLDHRLVRPDEPPPTTGGLPRWSPRARAVSGSSTALAWLGVDGFVGWLPLPIRPVRMVRPSLLLRVGASAA